MHHPRSSSLGEKAQRGASSRSTVEGDGGQTKCAAELDPGAENNSGVLSFILHFSLFNLHCSSEQ
jgi:hypothetical protein